VDVFPYISWENFLPFLLACIVIEITPGPNMAFLTIVSAIKGRKYGFATVAGITIGLGLIGFAAAAGLSTVLSTSPILYHFLKFSGVLYLLWLALIEWKDFDDNVEHAMKPTQDWTAYFRHGLIVNILNPKAAVFYVTILPGFIAPSEFVFQQASVLTLISIAIATIAHVLIVSVAGGLTPLIENPEKKRLLRRGLSLSLAAIAIWIGIKG